MDFLLRRIKKLEQETSQEDGELASDSSRPVRRPGHSLVWTRSRQYSEEEGKEATAGVERVNKGVDESTIYASVGLDDGRPSCVWPCHHHQHYPEAERGFHADAAAVGAAVREGRATCSMFDHIARSRCSCVLSRSVGGTEVHPYTGFDASFVKRRLVALKTHRSCGMAEMEIVTLDGESLSPFGVQESGQALRRCRQFSAASPQGSTLRHRP